MSSEMATQVERSLRDAGIAVPPPPPVPGNPQDDDASSKVPLAPMIELPRDGHPLPVFAREAGAIAKTNGIFRRDQVIVTINKETAGMEPMSPDRFRTYLPGFSIPYKLKVLGEGENAVFRKIPCTMNVETARGTLASDDFIGQQRRLAKINSVQMPVMRADGKIELLPIGYDAASEIYTMKNDVVIDETWDVDRARTFLLDLHKEFPFANRDAAGLSRGLAIHIAGMLALFACGLQEPTEPRINFVYTANSPRSGKTLLVQLVVIPVMGLCEVQTIPDSPQEFRKVLDSTALGASPYLFFDEIEGNIRNKDLNAFITAPYWSGRAFNVQRMFRCPKITICYLAGNNLTLQSDLEGRTLLAELYIEESNARDRKVGKVLSARHLAKSSTRGDILSALWALIRDWDVKGRYRTADGKSRVEHLKPGFESWSEIFGGIVASAGLGDPMAPPSADESPDTEQDDMMMLVKALSHELGKTTTESTVPIHHVEYKFDELIECCLAHNCFSWIIDGKWRMEKESSDKWYEVTPKSGAIMGKLFSARFGGRIFNLGDGRRVRFGARGKNRQRRYVVKLEDVPVAAASGG